MELRKQHAKPGQVVETTAGAAVLTGEGIVRLGQIQLAGKRATSVEEFLRGRPDFAGARLPS